MLFKINGTVTPYRGHGRKIGYPTANIPIQTSTPEGLFVGTMLLEGSELPAIIFIGAPTTLEDYEKRAEAHILDFVDRDLYNTEVVFTIQKKLRGNKKFSNESELLRQMRLDEIEARKYFRI